MSILIAVSTNNSLLSSAQSSVQHIRYSNSQCTK